MSEVQTQTQLTKSVEDDQTILAAIGDLSVQETAAMEILMRGGTIIAAAEAAGVTRQSIYDWLDTSCHFGRTYLAWKQSMAETARTRLLMLAEKSTEVVAHSLHRGDTRTAMKILTGMGILASPPVGPPASEIKARKLEAQAVAAEREVAPAPRAGDPVPDDIFPLPPIAGKRRKNPATSIPPTAANQPEKPNPQIVGGGGVGST